MVSSVSPNLPSHMSAWVFTEYGEPQNVLNLKTDVPLPELKPDQVLIKVAAAALNPADYARSKGDLRDKDPPFPITPGFDVAGVVVRVGDEVKKLKVGDEVYGNVCGRLEELKRHGSLAEYTVVEETILVQKPHDVSFAEAASLPVAIGTAYGSLESVGLRAGQSILVLGGAGGCGSLVIQLAKRVFGASKVAATCSTGKLELVRKLGADLAIDYTKQNIEDLPEKFDIVYDTVGEDERAVKAIKEGGKVLSIIHDANDTPPRIAYMMNVFEAERLEKVRPFLESGKVKAVLDPQGPFPFSQAVAAFKHLQTRRATGKIVIHPVP